MNGFQNAWRPTNGQPQGLVEQNTDKNAPYPANREEVAQFIADIMNGLYSGGQSDKIAQSLLSAREAIGQVMGQIAASLVMTVIMRRGKENGRTPRQKLVERGITKAIAELAEIANAAGVKGINENTMKQAAMSAVQLVRKQFGQNFGQPQGQQPGQPEQPPQAPQAPQGNQPPQEPNQIQQEMPQ